MPEMDKEWDSIVEMIMGIGISFQEATATIKKRKKAYTTTMSKHQPDITMQSGNRGGPLPCADQANELDNQCSKPKNSNMGPGTCVWA